MQSRRASREYAFPKPGTALHVRQHFLHCGLSGVRPTADKFMHEHDFIALSSHTPILAQLLLHDTRPVFPTGERESPQVIVMDQCRGTNPPEESANEKALV